MIPYGAFSVTYLLLWGGFFFYLWKFGVVIPWQVTSIDLVLLLLASYRLTELISEEKITRWLRKPFCAVCWTVEPDGKRVQEEIPQGNGLQRGICEMLLCPFCLGIWVATLLVFLWVLLPEIARLVLLVFATSAGAIALQTFLKTMDKARDD